MVDQKAAIHQQEIADLHKEVFTKLEAESEHFSEALKQAKARREEERAILEIETKQLKQEVAELKEASKETDLLQQSIDDLRSEQKEAVSNETEQMRKMVDELRQKQAETLEVELRQMKEEQRISTSERDTTIATRYQ